MSIAGILREVNTGCKILVCLERGTKMNVVILLVSLVIALVVLIPLLEKYQQRLGLDKMQKYAKYVLPLLMVTLIIKLIYVLVVG